MGAAAAGLALTVATASGTGPVTAFHDLGAGPVAVHDPQGAFSCQLASGALARVRLGKKGVVEPESGGGGDFPRPPAVLVTDLVVGPDLEVGERFRSSLCPAPKGAQRPCDHQVSRVSCHGETAWITGRIAPEVGRGGTKAWAALWTAGKQPTELTWELGLSPQVEAVLPGPGVLVVGRDPQISNTVWWAPVDPQAPVASAPKHQAKLYYPKASWRVGVPREGGWTLALDDGRGWIQLVQVAADGSVEGQHPVERRVSGNAFGGLFTVGEDLWLLIGEQGSQALQAVRVDPESGAVLEEANQTLPSGFWAHALHGQDGAAYLGGVSDQPVLASPTVLTLAPRARE